MRSKLRDSHRIRTGAYDRRFNSVEAVLQRGLALDLPRTAEVEGVEDQLVLSASSSSACSSEKSGTVPTDDGIRLHNRQRLDGILSSGPRGSPVSRPAPRRTLSGNNTGAPLRSAVNVRFAPEAALADVGDFGFRAIESRLRSRLISTPTTHPGSRRIRQKLIGPARKHANPAWYSWMVPRSIKWFHEQLRRAWCRLYAALIQAFDLSEIRAKA